MKQVWCSRGLHQQWAPHLNEHRQRRRCLPTSLLRARMPCSGCRIGFHGFLAAQVTAGAHCRAARGVTGVAQGSSRGEDRR